MQQTNILRYTLLIGLTTLQNSRRFQCDALSRVFDPSSFFFLVQIMVRRYCQHTHGKLKTPPFGLFPEIPLFVLALFRLRLVCIVVLYESSLCIFSLTVSYRDHTNKLELITLMDPFGGN